MVTETILQLYKLRESGDFVTLSEEDDCYEFALRSPFSFGQFASLAQVTCPGLNKFGLLKVIKNAGTHRVLIPLSENNFTEVVTEAIQQQMSAQEDRHRSKLKICAWEKALSLTVEVATANSGLCEDRRLTPGFDRETGPVGFLEKSNESEIGKVMSDEANRKSNQSSTGRPKARTAVESFAGAGGSAVNRQCGERGTCRNSSAPTAGNYRQKAVRRALARFVKHVNFDDNAIVYAGAPFVKIWRIRNDSSTAWPQNSLIMAVGGESMIPETAPQKVPVPSLKPGEEQNIEISLTAPHAPGKYQGFYRFCSSEGKKFGQRLSCQIMVVDSNSTASESTSSDTSSDESSGDEERLRKVENNQGSRRGAKKQAKQKQRCEKRKRKLEKKAKKLRRKLEKVEKKLWKIHRSEESLLSQKRASNMVFDGGFPVAIPATFDDLKQSAATVSTVGVDANEEVIGDGIKCLSLEASTVGKGSNWDSTYQQLLSLGFSDTEVRKAIEKSGGDVVECLKYLTK